MSGFRFRLVFGFLPFLVLSCWWACLICGLVSFMGSSHFWFRLVFALAFISFRAGLVCGLVSFLGLFGFTPVSFPLSSRFDVV